MHSGSCGRWHPTSDRKVLRSTSRQWRPERRFLSMCAHACPCHRSGSHCAGLCPGRTPSRSCDGRIRPGLVAGGPGRFQPGVQNAPSLVPGDPALGRERVAVVEPGPTHALGIGEPLALDVQVPVDQRVPVRGGVGGVHRDDRVLDPPGRAGALPPDPGRGPVLLQIPGLVEDQDPAGAEPESRCWSR